MIGKTNKKVAAVEAVAAEPTLEELVHSGLVNVHFDEEWKELFVAVNVAGYSGFNIIYHPEKRYVRVHALPLASDYKEIFRGFAKDPLNLTIPLGSDSSIPYAYLEKGILTIKAHCVYRDAPRDVDGYVVLELDDMY